MRDFFVISRENYLAWVVCGDFGTTRKYQIYMELLRIVVKEGQRSNYFSRKHVGHSPRETFRERTLDKYAPKDATGRVLALVHMGNRLKEKAKGDEVLPAAICKTNTVVDLSKINEKTAASKLAEALLKAVLKRDQSISTVPGAEFGVIVDFGRQCVVSDGKDAGVGTKMKLVVEFVSANAKSEKLSFRIVHCAGHKD